MIRSIISRTGQGLLSVQKFIRSETGSLSVEAVLMMPMLFFALTAMFVFFDAYQIRNTTGKAGYTIADMLSRETFPINQTYLDDTRSVFAFLARSDVRACLCLSDSCLQVCCDVIPYC